MAGPLGRGVTEKGEHRRCASEDKHKARASAPHDGQQTCPFDEENRSCELLHDAECGPRLRGGSQSFLLVGEVQELALGLQPMGLEDSADRQPRPPAGMSRALQGAL